jgi:PAS domain S-box-containing protein
MRVSLDGSWERVLEAIPDAALAVAADGTILRANARAEQLFGYPSGALSGCSHDLLVPPASRLPHRGGLSAFFSSPTRRPMASGRTISALRADGSEFPAECFLSPLRVGDTPLVLAVVRELTESQRVERELLLRESGYRRLFEANPHPMWVYDRDTLGFLAVNEAAVRKYGYTRQEFLDMTIADIRPPEDVDRLRANVARVRSGLDEAGLWRHRTKDGAVLDVEIVSHALEWEGRRAELVLAHDVTARRRAEERLAVVTRLYAVLSQINQAIVRVREQGALFGVLCQVAVEHGQFRMAWVGLLDEATGAVVPAASAGHDDGYLSELRVAWRDGASRPGPTAEALASGAVGICDDIGSDPRAVARRDEALRRGYRSMASVPFRVRSRVVGILNLYAGETGFFTEEERQLLEEIGADISFALEAMETEGERRRAEEELRRRTEGLATLVEASRSLAATLDLTRILQATADGAARLFSLDTAAVYLLEGDAVRLYATAPPIPPDFPESLRRAPLAEHPHVRQAVVSRAPVLLPDAAAAQLTPAEEAACRARGLRSILYLPLLAGAEPVGVLIVASSGEPRHFSDGEVGLCHTLANLAALAVANARLYEAGLARAAELEKRVAERDRAEEEREVLQVQLAHAQKMEAVGRLAGGVAHDFNNMLAVILGRAELALRRTPPEGPLRRDLEEILQAAERSSVLTRQLLAFARRQTVSPQVLNLNGAVEGLLQMLRRLIGEDVELAWQPGDGAGQVRLDPSQLDQLLANLVVNARDAIAGTGRITLETRRVVLREPRRARGESVAPGRYALLRVVDDGCGMDEETLSHLFEPFFTTKEPGRGTGLGLATVYGIVRQNGGFVEVHSQPGRGTRFDVYLPWAPDGSASATGTAGGAGEGRGWETVLLVEDEEAILALGREILEELGYTVLAAATPAEALRTAEAYPGEIHLLITDVVMPGMNGRELAERLGAARAGLRCLYISGYTANVVAHRGILDEGVCLLQKPFTVRELSAKVRQALGPEGGPGSAG